MEKVLWRWWTPWKPGMVKNNYGSLSLLISKPVLSTAVRTFPCYPITWHPPYIFIHTSLANRKATPACPAKRKYSTAAVAEICSIFSVLFSVFCFNCWVRHDFLKVKIDEFVKSLWINAGWLSKKAHIQGVAVFKGRDYTI